MLSAGEALCISQWAVLVVVSCSFFVDFLSSLHFLLFSSLYSVLLSACEFSHDYISLQVGWSSERFDEIVGKLKQFLKQAGFRVSSCVGYDSQS